MPRNEASLTRETTPQLFVGGLSSSTTSKDLFNYFKRFGHVLSCEVQRAESGKSKRFGFVKFSDPRDAECVFGIPNHSVMNKQVTIEWALDPVAKQMSQQTRVFRKVYVGNIPAWARKEQIEATISTFGRIEKVTRLRKKDDGSMYCYAIMQEISSAQSLLKQQLIKSSESLQLIIKPFTPQKRKEESIRGLGISNKQSRAERESFPGASDIYHVVEPESLHGNKVPSIDLNSRQANSFSSRAAATSESRAKNSQLVADHTLRCSPSQLKISIRAGLELQLVDYSCLNKLYMPQIASVAVVGTSHLQYIPRSRLVPGNHFRFNISTYRKARLPGKLL